MTNVCLLSQLHWLVDDQFEKLQSDVFVTSVLVEAQAHLNVFYRQFSAEPWQSELTRMAAAEIVFMAIDWLLFGSTQ